MTARGNPASVALGPGKLYLAPLGSTAPSGATALSAPWDAAFVLVGYTDSGTTHTYGVTKENVTVAEEVDPIGTRTTARTGTVSFSAAENTALNYKRAFNGGVITVLGTGGSTVYEYEPPDLGQEVNVMLGWESESGDERWIWYNVAQTGSPATPRQPGVQKAVIPMEFSVYAVAGGKPFRRFSNRVGEVPGT